MERLWTVKDVATLLAVEPRTVRRWIASGSIGVPVFRVRQQYRFAAQDVTTTLVKRAGRATGCACGECAVCGSGSSTAPVGK
jgi:excisionase family DNA binding protein